MHMTSPDPHTHSVSGRSPIVMPHVVAVDQHFVAAGLYRIRAEVAAHAHAFGATVPQVEKLIIAAGELASNAVRHGGGRGQLRLWCEGTTMVCQVSDRGPGIADSTIGNTPPDHMAVAGRGLWICLQLCDTV